MLTIKILKISFIPMYQLRSYVKKKLYASGVSKVDIERKGGRVIVNIFTAKPGIVIGRGGAGSRSSA